MDNAIPADQRLQLLILAMRDLEDVANSAGGAAVLGAELQRIIETRTTLEEVDTLIAQLRAERDELYRKLLEKS